MKNQIESAKESSIKFEKWIMPEWMEKYRPYLDKISGGNPIEELMNDHGTTAFNNSIRLTIICQISGAVWLLNKLQEKGELKN